MNDTNHYGAATGADDAGRVGGCDAAGARDGAFSIAASMAALLDGLNLPAADFTLSRPVFAIRYCITSARCHRYRHRALTGRKS